MDAHNPLQRTIIQILRSDFLKHRRVAPKFRDEEKTSGKNIEADNCADGHGVAAFI